MSSTSSTLVARLSNGNLILRLGAAHQSQDLTLLETGEPMYSPVTQVHLRFQGKAFQGLEHSDICCSLFQEGPIFTEDLIKENEEFVIRTGRYSP